MLTTSHVSIHSFFTTCFSPVGVDGQQYARYPRRTARIRPDCRFCLLVRVDHAGREVLSVRLDMRQGIDPARLEDPAYPVGRAVL